MLRYINTMLVNLSKVEKYQRTICLVLLEVKGGSLGLGTDFALDYSFVTSNHFSQP